jgi:hypothetical protein
VPPPKDLVRYKEVRRADLRNDQKTAAQILNADAASVTQEQFQEFIISQIKRIIHGDNVGLWKDDFASQGVLSLEDLTAGSRFAADCLATDVIGDFVYVTGPAVVGVPQVTKVDIKMAGRFPAVGMIIDKTSITSCTVLVRGEVEVTPAILTPGRTYWIGDTAQLTDVLPLAGSGERVATQAIGYAIDTGRLVLSVHPTVTVRTG